MMFVAPKGPNRFKFRWTPFFKETQATLFHSLSAMLKQDGGGAKLQNFVNFFLGFQQL